MKRYNFTILEKIGRELRVRVNETRIERYQIVRHKNLSGPVGEAIDLLVTYMGGASIRIETDSFVYLVEEV